MHRGDEPRANKLEDFSMVVDYSRYFDFINLTPTSTNQLYSLPCFCNEIAGGKTI